jgi:hypothetical protein
VAIPKDAEKSADLRIKKIKIEGQSIMAKVEQLYLCFSH